ncbi:nucleoside hydrolase [Clostridium fallax]|uniref:Purine nucleosidase n=1 Tax=Clostridium fallax TaxID=1533 RepID=A0A1M4YPP9_9CLOT|nr:nucleoside hydrolase [Clostridium fallax]SHF07774.1 purine nucleosidase [Clostridium fallax]SQB07518.1 nucleoside hydrolase, IUNH family [Clostridium fallax]
MERRKVIIDCDPGIDDALAIMLALSSKEIEVIGITIVSGNVRVEKGYKNALKILNKMNRLDIPVYVGEKVPLVRELITAEDTHGEDGLGETYFEEIEVKKLRENAVDFILKTLEKNKKDTVSIIALGPLTNLAKAIQKDKEVFNKAKEIVSMGGTYKSHGNCSPVAEFNYWVDPHSVRHIFHNIKIPFFMVGLDVTRKCVLTPNYIELLRQFKDEKADFIVDITRFYVDFHWKQERTLGCVINDPLAVEYFINRDVCKGFYSYVDVVTEGIAIGQTIVDKENFYKRNPNCFVLTEVDNKYFMKDFLKRIFKDKVEDIDLIFNNNL